MPPTRSTIRSLQKPAHLPKMPLTDRSVSLKFSMSALRPTPDGARSILSAAAELFAIEGFESVSIAEIAAQAGVSKANVFHHFDSKEALFMAVMRDASGEHAVWAEALLAEPGRCADKLKRLVAFEIETMFTHDQRTRLILREFVDHGTCHGRKLAQQVFRKNFSAVVALFRQGQANGEFHKDFDPAVAAITFRGALTLYFQCGDSLRQFEEAGHLDSAPEFAERVCDILLRGVTAAPRPARKPARKKK